MCLQWFLLFVCILIVRRCDSMDVSSPLKYSFCKKSLKPNGTYRQVVCTDTTAWLKQLPSHSSYPSPISSSSSDENVGQLFPEDCLWHVFTSMPDISEINALFVSYPNQIAKAIAYEEWIENTAFDIFTNLPENCYAVFTESSSYDFYG